VYRNGGKLFIEHGIRMVLVAEVADGQEDYLEMMGSTGFASNGVRRDLCEV